jgi:hypothetical protein
MKSSLSDCGRLSRASQYRTPRASDSLVPNLQQDKSKCFIGRRLGARKPLFFSPQLYRVVPNLRSFTPLTSTYASLVSIKNRRKRMPRYGTVPYSRRSLRRWPIRLTRT